MHLRARYRREVVEEILDIRVFTHMDLLLRQKQSELAKSVQDVKFRYNLMTEKYEMQKKHFEEVLSRDNTDLEDKRKLIADNHKDNLVYKDKLEKLNEEIISKKQKLWHKDEENSKQTKLAKLEI